MGESVLVIEVAEADGLVREWRRVNNRISRSTIPAHITVLFPFRPPEEIDDGVIEQLAGVLFGVPSFTFELTEIADFPRVLWLRPVPEEPFRELTSKVCAAFPDCSPYSGSGLDPQPHLTVTRARKPQLKKRLKKQLTEDFGRALPLRCEAESVSLFTRDSRAPWVKVRQLPLGQVPPGNAQARTPS